MIYVGNEIKIFNYQDPCVIACLFAYVESIAMYLEVSMYPLKFESIYCEKIWGGTKIQEFREGVPSKPIGESWDLVWHKELKSVVKNGRYAGRTLDNLIINLGELLVGRELNKSYFNYRDFPFLIKIIDSVENLSLQVHPDDSYAEKVEGDNGKLEAWYILSCSEGAEIVLGVRESSKKELKTKCINGRVEDVLNKVKVSPGDFYVIEPGLVHSIGGGILLAEFQKNSDITYRVYDYERGRQLHLEKAFQVIDINKRSNKITISEEEKIVTLIKEKNFNLQVNNIGGVISEKSNMNGFYIYTCVGGQGKILYSEGGVDKEEEINYLDTILIPASMGEYSICGNLKLVKLIP